MDRGQPSLATPNRPTRVPESLDKRLLAYTLAASAGLAAAPELAQATIVYTDISDITISSFGLSIPINLNNAGPVDALVTLNGESGGFSAYAEVSVWGNGQPTSVLGQSGFAFALSGGNPINPGGTFANIQAGSQVMAYASYESGDGYYYGGAFLEAGDRYLGFMFKVNGLDYFGWALLNVDVSVNEGEIGEFFAAGTVILRSYAFENCAGVGINAGDQGPGASCPSGVPMPPALALVALGAGGLALWRARRRDGQ